MARRGTIFEAVFIVVGMTFVPAGAPSPARWPPSHLTDQHRIVLLKSFMLKDLRTSNTGHLGMHRALGHLAFLSFGPGLTGLVQFWH